MRAKHELCACRGGHGDHNDVSKCIERSEIRPSIMNWSAGYPTAGSRNCGMNARKKAAVLGLKASTTTPSRNTLFAPVGPVSAGGALLASQMVLIPSQIR